MNKKEIINYIVQNFEQNVNEYNQFTDTGKDEVCKDRKYSAYALTRVLQQIDTEIGNAAVDYLRENNL